MPDSTHQIILVTPVWNDSTRLAKYGASLATAFSQTTLPIHWVIADDGSVDYEKEKLAELREAFSQIFPRVDVHLAQAHRGKGAVIREAWSLHPNADWLAFVDADGSVEAEDLVMLINKAVKQNQSALGIRKRTAVTRITESAWRAIFHRGFLITAHLILRLKCEDPQCGAKVFMAKDYQSVCHLLEEDGFAFDSELLAALSLHGFEWMEVPVNWAEKKGGKVRPLRDAWGMFFALLRIRNRLL